MSAGPGPFEELSEPRAAERVFYLAFKDCIVKVWLMPPAASEPRRTFLLHGAGFNRRTLRPSTIVATRPTPREIFLRARRFVETGE